MKLKMLLVSLIGIGCMSNTLFAEEGADLFSDKCAACHSMTRPSDKSTLVAPPVMGVMRHVKMKYNTKEDAVDFIVEYALNPQKEKAVCMPAKIQRFGLMPSQRGSVTKEELQTIASWMYENFPSNNFQGKGRGQGQACKGR